MNELLIFFCLSCGVLVLGLIFIGTAPIINGLVGKDWNIQNCQKFKDIQDSYKDANINEALKELYLDYIKRGKTICEDKKAMYGLEYSSIILNLILGFMCGLLALLHNLDIGTTFIKQTGLIGTCSNLVGFVLIFIYLCYSSFLFSNESPDLEYLDSTDEPGYYKGTVKLYSDGSYAKWDESKVRYICYNYDINNVLKFYAKYNDLGKKQYNYNIDILDQNSKLNKCVLDNGYVPINVCEQGDIYTESTRPVYNDGNSNKKCETLHVNYNSFDNEYLFNRWITTIILASLIAACNLALIFFGIRIFFSPIKK
jgi:hypothetical protein